VKASSFEIRVTRLNEVPDAPAITQPANAVEYWRSAIEKMPWYIADREVCVTLTVNAQNRVTGHHLVSIGTLNETVIHAREVFRAAVAMNAYGVVLMHNHPSGGIDPSSADRQMTERLAKAADILQIKLLDHVIVAAEQWFSFREAGLL
jgi:DNA repair protein RadC